MNNLYLQLPQASCASTVKCLIFKRKKKFDHQVSFFAISIKTITKIKTLTLQCFFNPP